MKNDTDPDEHACPDRNDEQRHKKTKRVYRGKGSKIGNRECNPTLSDLSPEMAEGVGAKIMMLISGTRLDGRMT